MKTSVCPPPSEVTSSASGSVALSRLLIVSAVMVVSLINLDQ